MRHVELTAASSDCSRPVNNYVHVKTADLYRPNARLTRKDRDIRYLRHLGNSDIANFLGLSGFPNAILGPFGVFRE